MQRTIPAKLELIRPVLATIVKEAKERVAPTSLWKLELALEEALVNIVKHAYKDPEGAIDITSFSDKNFFMVILCDKGVAFDPTQELSTQLFDASFDKLGLRLMRESSELAYERKSEYNFLTLKVPLQSAVTV
jgi:anti-sigma regulatory factor (Ser/Thr protein kinase)